MIRGVLFDMDGVLVDSESFMCEAAIRMFAEKNLKVSESDFEPFVGMGENRYLGGVAEKYGHPFDRDRDKARAYELYGEIAEGQLQPLPGVGEFIRRCRDKGLKLAVATSADRVKMDINLRELRLEEGTFDRTVNGLEVERRKPHPDLYLEAARRLGLDPGECLVVEDALSGIEAARAAGCRCLALTTSLEARYLTGADWICGTLADAPDEAISW